MYWFTEKVACVCLILRKNITLNIIKFFLVRRKRQNKNVLSVVNLLDVIMLFARMSFYRNIQQ